MPRSRLNKKAKLREISRGCLVEHPTCGELKNENAFAKSVLLFLVRQFACLICFFFFSFFFSSYESRLFMLCILYYFVFIFFKGEWRTIVSENDEKRRSPFFSDFCKIIDGELANDSNCPNYHFLLRFFFQRRQHSFSPKHQIYPAQNQLE